MLLTDSSFCSTTTSFVTAVFSIVLLLVCIFEVVFVVLFVDVGTIGLIILFFFVIHIYIDIMHSQIRD